MNISQIDFKKNEVKLAILIIFVSIIGLVLYFNFVLKPHVARVFSLMIEANKLSSDLKNARADIANIPKFKNDIGAYKEKVERYEKMLPAEREIPSLLESLSNMAKNANVKIVGIMPAVAEAEKTTRTHAYQEIPILINAKSGYHELGHFLSNMGNSDRFMKIADINIKSSRDNSRKHDVELLILTYMLLKGK